MKKYVAPMSCVLSMKMDENIAYSNYVSINTKYALTVDGKIQNTPIIYTGDSANYMNNIVLSIGYWLLTPGVDYAALGQHMIDMGTKCYIGDGEPEIIPWPKA